MVPIQEAGGEGAQGGEQDILNESGETVIYDHEQEMRDHATNQLVTQIINTIERYSDLVRGSNGFTCGINGCDKEFSAKDVRVSNYKKHLGAHHTALYYKMPIMYRDGESAQRAEKKQEEIDMASYLGY